jgi:branched-chain amino acid aminotransferase
MKVTSQGMTPLGKPDLTLVPFDDRDGFIWMNGEALPWRQATTHVLTHGLHYGSRVFDGERAYGGRIFKSREHAERLKFSAEQLAMTQALIADYAEAVADLASV